MNWRQFFEIMIIDERAAQAKYEAALAEVEDPQLRVILERLRDEEAFHVDYLEESWARLSSTLEKP